MKTQKVKINKIRLNPDNPRLIRDDNFEKLVKSVKDFPEMMDIRPVVVNKDMVIIGGNMRYRAAIEAGFKEITIIIADNLTEDQEKEFVIKDNVSGGEWDFDMLANSWQVDKLEEWGVTIPDWAKGDINLDDFFEDNGDSEKEQKFKIVLEYTEDDYNKVIEALKDHPGSKEEVFCKLLGI